MTVLTSGDVSLKQKKIFLPMAWKRLNTAMYPHLSVVKKNGLNTANPIFLSVKKMFFKKLQEIPFFFFSRIYKIISYCTDVYVGPTLTSRIQC